MNAAWPAGLFSERDSWFHLDYYLHSLIILQGILMLQDQYRAIMQYSIPKELCPSSEKAPTHKASADWFCIKV